MALQNGEADECSENLGIIRRCIDSIVDKILSPPGFCSGRSDGNILAQHQGSTSSSNLSQEIDGQKTYHLSDLDIDLFRCIITALKSTYLLPPQLIAEALHV
ncbi:unnamed protein product, partial [Linum tenue]